MIEILLGQQMAKNIVQNNLIQIQYNVLLIARVGIQTANKLSVLGIHVLGIESAIRTVVLSCIGI